MISTKKRIFSALMATVMIISVVFTVNITAFAENTERDFIYEDTDGGVAITDYTGSASDIVIPGTLGGKTVKKVIKNTFARNDKLEMLTIPASVVSFNEDMLESCPNLREIIVDAGNENYTSRDGVLFSKDMFYLYIYPAQKSDESYKIPYETGSINSFCGNTHLKSIDLSNKAKTRSIAINSFAFKNCTALENVNIGSHSDNPIYDSSVIGYRAFLGCTALKRIVIPSTVRSIQESPFAGCTALEEISVASANEKYCAIDGVLFERDADGKAAKLLFYPPAAKNTEYTTPDGVTAICRGAFSDCRFTYDITISDSVTELEDGAFENSASFRDVRLGAGITEIPSSCFRNSGLKVIRRSAVITKIGAYSFMNCANLDNIDVLISNISEIPDYAFANCTAIPDIHFSDANIKIGSSAFSGCTLLSSVNLSGCSQFKTIGSYAFENCSSLQSVSLGNEVESVGNAAFYNCSALKNMTIMSMNTQFDYNALGYSDGDDGFIKKTDIIVTCRLNSIAQAYAKENGFDYQIIDHYSVCGSSTSDYKITQEPDCTHAGKQNIYCAGCGQLFARDITINPLGHNEDYTLVGYAPTCTNPGLTNGTKCSRCGETVTPQQSIPATGHGKIETVKGYPATCEKNGLTDGQRCTVCNEMTKEQQTIPATGHVNTETLKGYPAECTKDGLTDGTKCSDCGKILKEQQTIGALGHDYKDGICARCGKSESEPELTLKPDSKLVLDNENKTVILTPESAKGMKAADFKAQFGEQISLSADDDKIIANGMTFTYGGNEYIIIVMGDVNADGKITTTDARIVLRIAAKLESADGTKFTAADLNSDGRVMPKEARSVLRFVARLSSSLAG